MKSLAILKIKMRLEKIVPEERSKPLINLKFYYATL
jgi:hypothetical protein